MVLLMLLTLGCKLTHRQGKVYFDENTVPPNGIRVGPNFYCDQTEIGNIDWLEYMYWTGSVFGGDSEEYLATLPDTNVWLNQDSSLHELVDNYLRYPAYRYNPVVGVSYSQVLAYSKWRADRVFELMLFTKGILTEENFSKENYFTIEKYVNGVSLNLKPDSTIKYYPSFYLPTITERKMILSFSDSLDTYYLKNSRKYRKCFKEVSEIHFHHDANDIRAWLNNPTRNYYNQCYFRNKTYFYDLRGNVCEFLSDSTLCAGGSWIHTEERILQSDTFHISGPNAYTGFRNVCEWRPIEELLDSKNK